MAELLPFSDGAEEAAFESVAFDPLVDPQQVAGVESGAAGLDPLDVLGTVGRFELEPTVLLCICNMLIYNCLCTKSVVFWGEIRNFPGRNPEVFREKNGTFQGENGNFWFCRGEKWNFSAELS